MIPLRNDQKTTTTPYVNVALIAACIVAFLGQIMLPEEAFLGMIYAFGSIPALLFTEARLPPEFAVLPPTATLFSALFVHGGWAHIAGNMLYLWIFGDNIEDAMGHARYLVFYLLCGALAGLSHAIMNPMSAVPVVGASGAVSGVLGAYVLLYPHARVLVFLPLGPWSRLVRFPAFWVLGFWFAFQVLNSLLAPREAGGVAWFAHIGGFLAGMLLIPFFKRAHIAILNPPRGSTRLYRRF